MAKSPANFKFPVNNGDFRKSRYSDPGGLIKTCVEIARKPEGVAIRDSKNPNGPVLYFTHAEFDVFEQSMKEGEFGR